METPLAAEQANETTKLDASPDGVARESLQAFLQDGTIPSEATWRYIAAHPNLLPSASEQIEDMEVRRRQYAASTLVWALRNPQLAAPPQVEKLGKTTIRVNSSVTIGP